MKTLRRAVAAVALVAALGAMFFFGIAAADQAHAPAARAATASCPLNTTCIPHKLLVQDPVKGCTNEFEVNDPDGAPMLWINCGGEGSGGEPVCAFGLNLKPLACLGGPWGNYGARATIVLYSGSKKETLTYHDLAELHKLEKK